MKKLITAALTLALLAALTGASASEAGTASDPLITKDYAETVYAKDLLDAGLERMQAAFSDFSTTLDILGEGGGDILLTYTRGQEAFTAEKGGSVSMGLGGSFILISGGVTVTYDFGEVIDTSTGKTAASGTSLKPYIRYFVTEDMLAVFTVTSAAQFFLDGPYSAGSGVYSQYSPYGDVQANQWFYDAALYCHDNRLFHDWDADLFRPDDAATRAEMIYALWASAGFPETDAVSPFRDLTEDWYVPAVNWAYEQGITNGSGAPDLFDPDGLLTRQQVTTMYFRWSERRGLDVSGRADLSIFPDRGIINAEWAAEGASWCLYVGLIQGSNGYFLPEDDITRAEVITIVMRYDPYLHPVG